MRREMRVDTPERRQGLECPVMIVTHPLSGVLMPSAFDLETSRPCVMACKQNRTLWEQLQRNGRIVPVA